MPTQTFNPDADPETSSVDGVVARSSVDQTYSALRTGAGNNHDDTTTGSLNMAVIEASTTTNQFKSIWRGIFVFDTSGLGNIGSITSATFKVYVEGKADQLGGSHEVALVDTTPASDTDLVDADYGQVGTTKQATNLTVSSITTSAYNTWTLDATGRASINPTGKTKFALRIERDRANSEPPWGSLELTRIFGQYAGGANPPELSVTYLDAVEGAYSYFM
jgi:hypothetical protein